jgi:hypothetical protein
MYSRRDKTIQNSHSERQEELSEENRKSHEKTIGEYQEFYHFAISSVLDDWLQPSR